MNQDKRKRRLLAEAAAEMVAVVIGLGIVMGLAVLFGCEHLL